jgi:methionyl-tRNA synthetase
MIQNPKDIRLQRHCERTDSHWPFGGCLRAIGHLFRYLRLQGRVLFVCGSDEHGVAISMKAKEGITPRK